jgi:hypothetical protein
MIQRFIQQQLPSFAQTAHPVMRYTLLREGRKIRPNLRVLRMLMMALFLTILIFFGYSVATQFGTRPLDEITNFSDNGFGGLLSILDRVYLILFWPLVLIQIGMRLGAFAATTGTITQESSRGTWETLKLTTDGAGLALRTRWFSVFYQLRYLLFLVVALRVFFVIVALADFVTFNGQYINLALTGSVPLGSDPAASTIALSLNNTLFGIVCIALQFVAALIAPFTVLAFDAALGTLLGVMVRGRWMGILSQILILLLRLVISGVALMVGAWALNFSLFFSSPGVISSTSGATIIASSSLRDAFVGFPGIFVGLVEGDLGLTLLFMSNASQRIYTINYGILIGIAALLYFLLQALLAKLMLGLAVRLANRAGRN